MGFVSVNEQLKIIKRGTIDLLPENELIDKLNRSIKTNKPLHIKMGFDPTAPDIHLGHTVGIRKLRHFQELGHKVIVIIGDYTATVGDPSDKKTTRPRLAHSDVLKNAETYKKQMLKILKPDLTEFKYNGDWFKTMPFSDVMSLAASTTVAQMLERNDFSNRYKNRLPISLHEFFYPLMQAYDSVMIDADIELGATEQKFNLVMGRTIQEAYDKEKQCILTLPVLVGLDGVNRMSKSLGNYIGIDESPKDIYGKTLSIPDEQIYPYFELVTDVELDELSLIKELVKTDPRNTKRQLARKLVSMYHGEIEAVNAEAEFDRIFIKKDVPDEIPEYEIDKNPIPVLDLITEVNFAESKGEARRLIRGNGVSYNNEKISDENLEINLVSGHVLKVGKKRFIKTV